MVLLHKHITYQNTLFIVAITLLVSHSLSMLNTLLHISQFGLASVILALSSAWIADTGAYFAGTFLGKHKLCPEISPKKTVEGFFGGIVTDVVVMVIFSLIYSLIAHAHVHYLWLIFIGIVCAVISVLGDLSASVLKRQQGIKDFGNIMPGHGGVMDRFVYSSGILCTGNDVSGVLWIIAWVHAQTTRCEALCFASCCVYGHMDQKGE